MGFENFTSPDVSLFISFRVLEPKIMFFSKIQSIVQTNSSVLQQLYSPKERLTLNISLNAFEPSWALIFLHNCYVR